MKAHSYLLVVLCLGLGAGTPAYSADPPVEEGVTAPATQAVLLGRFSIRDFRAAEGVKLRLNFALYADIASEDIPGVERLLEARKHRVRSAILTAVRTVEQSDFQQPGLERLRRRVFVRLGRVEPQLPIQELLVGEFEYFVD